MKKSDFYTDPLLRVKQAPTAVWSTPEAEFMPRSHSHQCFSAGSSREQLFELTGRGKRGEESPVSKCVILKKKTAQTAQAQDSKYILKLLFLPAGKQLIKNLSSKTRPKI